MGIAKNSLFNSEYSYDRITGEEVVDVQEMLARQKQNTLWSNFTLTTDNEQLQELFDAVEKYNNLTLLFKGMERYLSKDGKVSLVWDIFTPEEFGTNERVPILYMGKQSRQNQTMRFAQQKEFAGIVEIEATANQQGIKQVVRQLRTNDQTQQIVLINAVSDNIPIDIFLMKTPKFLKLFQQSGIRNHNYGVLSVKEILNKSIVDFNGDQDAFLVDDYPVSHLRNMINGMLVFYKKEQVKNSTKWVGKFGSYQDMFKPQSPEAKVLNLINGQHNKDILKQLANRQSYEKTILEDDYILPTTGSQMQVDKIQSTFDGEQISRAITSLLEIYFNGAGMDFSMQSMSGASQYTNNAGIQTQNRRTTETIKECIVLREKQYGDCLKDLIDAWFGKVGKHKEFDGQWQFKILSNIVNEEQYSTEKIVLMQENGLISKKVAIQKANKDMSKWELDKMISDIEKEEKEREAKEQMQIKENYGE